SALDTTLDPHLASERFPVEEERGVWVCLELTAFATGVARVEHEAALVESLQQHHAQRRRAVAPGRRDRHRLRRGHDAAGFAEPNRKSTRLNSSHEWISYAVFCLKKNKQTH